MKRKIKKETFSHKVGWIFLYPFRVFIMTVGVVFDLAVYEAEWDAVMNALNRKKR